LPFPFGQKKSRLKGGLVDVSLAGLRSGSPNADIVGIAWLLLKREPFLFVSFALFTPTILAVVAHPFPTRQSSLVTRWLHLQAGRIGLRHPGASLGLQVATCVTLTALSRSRHFGISLIEIRAIWSKFAYMDFAHIVLGKPLYKPFSKEFSHPCQDPRRPPDETLLA
jgi:hypothetical protein